MCHHDITPLLTLEEILFSGLLVETKGPPALFVVLGLFLYAPAASRDA